MQSHRIRAPRSHSRSGFTIIELLVVLAISALFSTLAITYSTAGQNTVALSVEQAKISQFIVQAKELSLATYTSALPGSAKSCGYGVAINYAANPQTYSIFTYSPVNAPNPCPDIEKTPITSISNDQEKEYTAGTWRVPLSNGVKLLSSQGDSLVAILFYPPDPTTLLLHESDNNGTFSAGDATVYLQTIDGNDSGSFSVNGQGQISL